MNHSADHATYSNISKTKGLAAFNGDDVKCDFDSGILSETGMAESMAES